jgi:UDP:flavonoid glycosyltransferase YjiC (YdhE family)
MIQAHTGCRLPLHRNAAVAPVAAARRLIFCPKPFDFARSRTQQYFWGDAAIDLQRDEPAFDWSLLPSGKPLIYCAQGTQSARDSAALPALRNILRWIAGRPDLCMVVACPANQHFGLSQVAPPNCIVAGAAPQLSLLRRASAAIVHAGFNTVKECVAFAVPMLAVPLSHDQPRNAALVQARGVGLSANASTLTPEGLERAMQRLLTEPTFRAAAEHFRGEFEAARGSSLRVVDGWLAGAPRRRGAAIDDERSGGIRGRGSPSAPRCVADSSRANDSRRDGVVWASSTAMAFPLESAATSSTVDAHLAEGHLGVVQGPVA